MGNSTRAAVTANLNYSGRLTYGPEDLVRITLVMVGLYGKCFSRYWNPSQTTAGEVSNIEFICGAEVSRMLDIYIDAYTATTCYSPAAARDRDAMYAAVRPSKAQYERLQQFICRCPYVVVLPDHNCAAADGVVLTVHPLKVEVSQCMTSVIAGDNAAALISRTSSGTLHVMAVSQMAYNALCNSQYLK